MSSTDCHESSSTSHVDTTAVSRVFSMVLCNWPLSVAGSNIEEWLMPGTGVRPQRGLLLATTYAKRIRAAADDEILAAGAKVNDCI